MAIRILCLGDIVGRPGRQILHQKLPSLVKHRQVDLVIANAENIAGGSGITANLFNKIRSYGVDVVTQGKAADVFIYGKYINLIDTRVIIGGSYLPPTTGVDILSREVVHVQIPAAALPTLSLRDS